ncbi:MAG: MFS transporter [Pseudomonadota bacterium]|uniref:MFS transporter n=1 Tax=Phenylobacterium sp. TaxID=1871053 RepID=UPI00271A6ED0|nr:MFS transporter [Phenylobacterium sp.]MDO9433382.1 MFS transporter [Phenylobacterium sp.]
MGKAQAADSADGSGARLSVRAKTFYGVGSVAFGVSTLGLSSAVLQPYLNRVIGLPALWVGTAIMLTLMLDALIDPAVGQWSDKLRTKWGRRHPFMYASAPLVAAACIGFWNAPADWPKEALGAYLIGMLALLRICVSLYEVPSQALAPELTSDYHQRTSLFSYRFFFGVIGGFGMNVVLYQFFLSPQNGGILNREAYGHYGVLAAVVMAVSILVSAIGTHHHIPRLAVPPQRQVKLSQLLREIGGTLSNRSLVVVMVSGLCSGIATGMTGALSQYFYLEFWGLTASHISFLALASVLASFAGIAITGPASRAWGKKHAMIGLFGVATTTAALPILFRLLGLMPLNGSPWVFAILWTDAFVATTLAIGGFIIISSMIADVVEDAAVATGVRSEGLLFAANGLLPKFTAGIGVFLSGVLLTVVAFPIDAAAGSAPPEVMRRLALIYLPLTFAVNTLSILVLLFYKIDKDIHEQNVATLNAAGSMAE